MQEQPSAPRERTRTRRIRVDIRDRMLRDQPIFGIVGPIAMPDPQAIVKALQRIANFGPRTRVALHSQSTANHWYYNAGEDDRRCEQLVTVVPPASRDTVEDLARDLASVITPEHPLHFFIAGEYIIQVNDHMLGDGKAFLDRLADVILLASGASEPSEWITSEREKYPLWRAARTTFLQSKQTRNELFAARRADRPPHEEFSDGRTVPWQPQLESAFVNVPRAQLQDIREWARRSDRLVTASSTLLVLVRKSLIASGIALQHDQTVVYDARRYLPSGTGSVNGNFITGCRCG